MDERAAGRVLVVDSDESSRRRLELLLIEAGFVVITADSSAKCLEVAQSAAPEVILLDIDLPGVGGLETCRHLKSRRETDDIPVMFMAAGDRDEQTTVEVIEAGASDFVSKTGSRPLLRARLEARVAGYRAQVRLKRVSMIDELTGLASRGCFLDSLRREVSSASRRLEVVCFLLADVDHFGKFNDKYGHAEGDRILQTVADVLRESVRDSDLLGRIGSDEFGVLLGATSPAGAESAAEKIRASVERALTQPTVSIGVSIMDAPVRVARELAAIDHRVEGLVADAHSAMSAAKRGGRNQVSVSWGPSPQMPRK